jgi:branched-chain amino acid transport system substrate-binding protein
VVIGPSLVAMCSAVAPLMKDGPVLYCLSPGLHPSPTGYAFSASASSSDQYEVLVRYARRKGWTKLAVLTGTDATGQDADNGIKQAMALPENHDIHIVAHEHFNLSDVSVAAQIERVKASGAQVFIAWVTGAPVATIFKGAIQAGLDLPIGISAGNQSFAQMARYASFLPKQLLIPSALFPPHEGVVTLDPQVEKVQHQMYDVLKAHDLKPDNMTADSWDAGLIVVNALRKLGPSATAAQLRDYIRSLSSFAGVDGLYDFKAFPERGLGTANTAIVAYDPAGPRWVWLSKPGGEPIER